MPVNRLNDFEKSDYNSEYSAALAPELDPIHAKLEGLRNLTGKLEDLQLQFLSDGEKRTQKKIENTINAINKDAMEIKNMMGKFDQQTQSLIKKGTQQNIIDIRRNQYSNCGKKLVEVTKGAWDMQKDHEEKRTNQAAKRLKVRFADNNNGKGMSDAEATRIASHLIQTGNEDQLFLLARDELERAMVTKEAVLEIEKAMRELYQMFCDLNVLVVEQGENMDTIETTVNKTTDMMQKGNQQLKDAKRHQRACVIS
eukprot:GILI01014409.1.p1 GENE.GILI01014409.1~~GILI01014409.1.p1  ORF type:complete len:255 (-),score=59.11 GILI01014409.1:105-869(-)